MKVYKNENYTFYHSQKIKLTFVDDVKIKKYKYKEEETKEKH